MPEGDTVADAVRLVVAVLLADARIVSVPVGEPVGGSEMEREVVPVAVPDSDAVGDAESATLAVAEAETPGVSVTVMVGGADATAEAEGLAEAKGVGALTQISRSGDYQLICVLALPPINNALSGLQQSFSPLK